jgi:hypothetical protein
MTPHHLNTGKCERCALIFSRYPGFNRDLQVWFETFQVANPTAHISCAGRGKADQEACFLAHTSNAHYGQSAHNYNLAIDIFRLTNSVDGTPKADYDRRWFSEFVGPAVASATIGLDWFGAAGSPYYELPHVQISNWKDLGYPLVE